MGFPKDQPSENVSTSNVSPTEIDLSPLEGAVNSASSSATGLWLSFLTFMAYLTMTVGSVSHEILLLARAIKLPVLNVELPLVAFFWIAPIFFILFHFYLLLQITILVRKVATYSSTLDSVVVDPQERERRRKRLDSFIIVQFLFGAEQERNGPTSMLLRGVAFITLVFAPVLVLLQFQVSFLPYHDDWVTWAHRITIVLDLRLAWAFWFAICHSNGEIRFPELDFSWKSLFRAGSIVSTSVQIGKRVLGAGRLNFRSRRLGSIFSSGVIVLSLFGLAYKGEPIERFAQVPYISDGELRFVSLSDLLLHGSIDMVAGRPRRYFSNVLVVPNRKLVEDDEVDNAFPSFSLRGRDLRGAILIGTDLRGVDFTGANLNDARLDEARLTLARFTCVLTPSRALTADKPRLRAGWPDDECTWLQRATFTRAQLEGADFSRARMHGAVLLNAVMQAARLNGTQLQEAILTGAQLQGAQLEGTNLTDAFLDKANFLGAKVATPQLKGALLSDTRFDLADLTVGWNSALVDPILFYPQQGGPGNNAKKDLTDQEKINLNDQNKRDQSEQKKDLSEAEIISTFKFAGISAGSHSNFTDESNIPFDNTGLDKTREAAVAMLAGQNRADGDLNFDLKRKNAAPKRWKEINETIAKANGTKSELIRLMEQRNYLIRFVCDTGSSPYIAGALIENERVWNIEQRVLNEILRSMKEDAVKMTDAETEAWKLVSKLKRSDDCPGVAKLKKQFRILLESYEDTIRSRLREASGGMSRDAAQLDRADMGPRGDYKRHAVTGATAFEPLGDDVRSEK